VHGFVGPTFLAASKAAWTLGEQTMAFINAGFIVTW
jgi:hypothetical protein